MKEQLQQKAKELRQKIWSIGRDTTKEKEEEINKVVTPLFNIAKNKEIEIKNKFSSIYKEKTRELDLTLKEIEKELIEIKKKENSTKWYKEDTIVCKWTPVSSWRSSGGYKLTGKRGVVKIYNPDIHEISSNVSSYSAPKAGDIVVFLLKKDNTMSKIFEIVSDEWNQNTFNYVSKMWLPEGVNKNA